MISIFASDTGPDGLTRLATVLGCGAVGIAVMTCAFWGWGRMARRLAGLPDGTWPVSAALGLAFVLFLGGLLNLCRAAYPAVLAAIVIVGLIFAALARRQDGRKPQAPKDERVWFYAVSAGVIALTAFAVATQIAPSLYNSGDDFQKYFAHAVRMVETGTLYGSPLDALGGETLGGQAFLQGFIVGFFPIRFINGADAVFCFFLCLALAGGVAIRRPVVGLAALVGALSVAIIDPQYVNVSSLFSTTAMVSALMILGADPREDGGGAAPRWRQAMAPALFYAGAIALKNTSIVFLALQFGFAVAGFLWTTRNPRDSFARAGWVAAWSTVFISPWLLLYAPFYLAALAHPLGRPATPVPDVSRAVDLGSQFSPAELFYGGSKLAYISLAAGLLLCALHAIAVARRDLANRRSLVALASGSAAAAVCYLFWVLVGPRMDAASTTLRYSIPVLIGATSAALPLWASVAARNRPTVFLLVAAGLVLLFASSARQRIGMLIHQGSELAYLRSWRATSIDQLRQYEQVVLNGGESVEVRHFQALVPPGAPLLAWIEVPFLLDFDRNGVVDVNVAGMSQGWARIQSFPYVMWQYSGVGIDTVEVYGRAIAFGRRTGMLNARALDVLLWLQQVSATSKILGDAHGTTVFKTNEGTLPPPD